MIKTYAPLVACSILSVVIGFYGLTGLSIALMFVGLVVFAFTETNRILMQDDDEEDDLEDQLQELKSEVAKLQVRLSTIDESISFATLKIRQNHNDLKLRVDLLEQRNESSSLPFGK